MEPYVITELRRLMTQRSRFMRYLVSCCLAVAFASTALCQQAPPAANDPTRNQLDAILQHWQETMGSIQTISAKCSRTSLSKTMNQQEVFDGSAKYMKPNLAMLEMHMRQRPQVFEKYICTGTFLYEYAPGSQQIRVHELPAPKPGQVSDDYFLSFLFGMKADEARRRYELKLVTPGKPDPWYVYIEIT